MMTTTTTTMRNLLTMIGLTAVIASMTTVIVMVMGSSVSPNDNDITTDKYRDRDEATDADDDDIGNKAGRNDKMMTTAGDDTTSCAANNDMDDRKPQFSYHPDDENLYLYHFDETPSTQDEAKIIAEELAGSTSARPSRLQHALPSFVVSATSQTNGRGTSGRQWLGAPGNIFVTIGIPQSSWLKLQNKKGSGSSRTGSIPLTLLPLKVGTEVAKLISEKLNDSTICHNQMSSSSSPRVTVKWPNDVLVDERKISGTLIESSSRGHYFLIGIGINLKYSPTIPTSGPNHGRPATSFQDFCDYHDDSNSDDKSSEKIIQVSWEELSRKWSVQLGYNLHSWLTSHSSSTSTAFVNANNNNNNGVDLAQSIVDGWKGWLDWDMELVMRDTAARERVKLVNVLPDGRVEVEAVDDRTKTGPRRTLVSDYFL